MKKNFVKIHLIFFLLLLIFVSKTFADDRRTDKSKLVIATFNAEFLWDGVEPEEGSANFPHKNSKDEAENHMQDIATVIKRINPDIINLVEVENLDALKTLNSKFLIGYGYKEYFVKGTDTYTGQDVCLLTRIDPENNIIERYEKKGKSCSISKSVSKNYYAKFNINNKKIALIGLHLLSRPSSNDRKCKREAQANAIADLALQLHDENYHLIVLGDFNDFDGDINCFDINDNKPITNVLKQIKTLNTTIDEDDLINVTTKVSKNDRYTSFWDKNQNDLVNPLEEFSSIDHILLSKNLESFIDYVYIDHDYNPFKVSDHYPITLNLKFPFNENEKLHSVRITSLLPNPIGNDYLNEKVILKNYSNTPINLSGWILRDKNGKIWDLSLSGTILSGDEIEILRNGKPMDLNNNGDTIELLHNGELIQSFTYNKVQEGELLFPLN